jgi:hypothetical protein
MSGILSTNNNIADFLFKKNLGIVDSQPGASYSIESSGNAKTKLFSSQLFSQIVPLNIPTDFTSPIQYVNANGTLSNTNNGLGLGTVQSSISYPYIQKVTGLKLENIVNINTYRFNDPSTSGNINLLQNAIPFNYNPDFSKSYTYTLYAEKGSPYSGSVSNPIAVSKYIIDTDAGYLYIVAGDWSSTFGTCFVSFYRYNGTIGIPTNIGNFAGAYLQGTGAIAYGGSAGYTGQGVNALAIGNFAGAYGQGTGSIAIGAFAGPTGMSANSIALNASGVSLHATGPTGGFYVAPIASYSGSVGPFTLLAYGADKQIVGITGAGMASMGILTVGGITGATGSFTALGATSIVTTSITGATGSFTALGATTIATSSITGATGSFTALSATSITTSSITGATGSFTALGATSIATSSITGATGSFTALEATAIATSSITGATGSFTALGATAIATSSITGATGSFTALGATTITTTNIAGATGYFTSLGAQEIIGSTGIFNFLIVKDVEYVKVSYTSQEYSVTGMTGAIGYFTDFGSNTITTSSITGAMGSFTSLGATSIATSSITGATGSFTALGSTSITTSSITGATGSFTALGSTSITTSSITGATGSFTSLGATSIATSSITGATGSFTALGAMSITTSSITGATGSFTALGATSITTSSITGATGSFTALEAGTGYIGNVVTSKIGTHAGMINQGANALAIGTFAGAYGQGTGSIAIGAFAGPTGMSANSIVLNASGTALAGTGPTGGFYVAPIASYKNASNPTGPFQLLAYGPDNQIVTVTGATGLNLSLSTPTVTYDSWLLANMIGAPPAVESLAVDSFTTTDVYITFSYPSQMYSGLSQSGLLPYINNMFVNIGMDGVSGIDINGVTGINYIDTNYSYIAPFPGFKNSFSKNFIAQTTPVEPAHVVQCINVTKSASKSSGLGTYTTTKTTPGKTLKSYTIPYTSLTSTQLATFYIWYANNNPNKNVAFIPFQYKGAQNPTQVGSLIITPSATSQSITITFTGSDMIDSGDALSTASINYAISYKSIDGSNKHRYGGTKLSRDVNGQTIGPTGATGGNQSQTNSASIYPDTRYSVTVNASNTTLGPSSFTGTTVTSANTTTGPAPPASQTSRSDPLSLNVLSAKSVFGGSTVSNLLKTTTNTLPSLTRPFNIHNSYESRGYTGPDPLVDFTSNLSGPVGSIGPSASIYGFSGSYSYPPSQQGGINLSFTTPVDINKDDATNGTDGYYLKTDTTVSISNASNIVASSNQYTLCVTGTYSSGNGASASAATTFYYDGETGTNGIPSISSQPTISIASASTGAVCGINVVTSISFNVGVIGVTGIGQYFYNKDGIISYTPNGPSALSFTPSREMDLSKLTSGTGANGFNTPISFQNTVELSGISNSLYYAGPVGVSVTPYNLGNTGGSPGSSNTFPLIFDPVSITALQTQTSIGTITTNNNTIIGTRVAPPSPNTIGNESANNPNNLLNNLTNGEVSFSSTPFLNTKSLKEPPYNYELLYINGKYTNTTTINYSGYLGNLGDSFNYTELGSFNNYRYATFAWIAKKLGSLPIVFTLNSDATNIGQISIDSVSGIAKIGSYPIILFFRIEDATSRESLNNTNATVKPISTPWINGNLLNQFNSDTTFGSGNYNLTTKSFNGLSSITQTGTSISFNVLLANALAESSDSKTYIYCRIGIPIPRTTPTTVPSFSFSSITCTIN